MYELNTMQTAFTTPDWVKDAVIYQIFPDRFARSEHLSKPGNLEPWNAPPTVYGFKGGDLVGVIEKLDYLQDLGITAIYFNPIFQSASNHRYHTHDYFKVDPLLGGDQAFTNLLVEANRRNIHIILDGVFNHASRGFFQFNHLLECGSSSPYIDWFTPHKFPLNAYQGKPNYECWAGLPALPKFNFENPQVREFIFEVTRHWLEKGIDGWRLDVPSEINDDDFWREFRSVVKGINPDAYIVGEIIGEASRWLKGDQFDAVMNYQFTQACLGFFGGESINRRLEKGFMGFPSTPVLTATQFAQRAAELLTIYPKPAVLAQMNLLSSHDMPRFLSLVSNDTKLYRMAVLFQMTYPGSPCLYYGEEIGLKNGPDRRPEDARYSFPWDERDWDIELLSFVKKCIAIRKAHPALRRGEFIPLFAKDQMVVYARRLFEEFIVVAINIGSESFLLDIEVDELLPNQLQFRNLLGPESVSIMHGHLSGLTLNPQSAAVLYASHPQ